MHLTWGLSKALLLVTVLVVFGPVAVAAGGEPVAAGHHHSVGEPALSTLGERPGMLVALPSQRILDTRTGLGGTRLERLATTTFQVGGRGGVPTSGVGSVVLNVTVVSPTSSGYLTVWGTGLPRPNSSNINFRFAANVSNQVIVQAGPDGKVNLFNGSAGSVEVLADVSGFYPEGYPGLPGAFVAIKPHRLVDTRTGLGGAVETTEGLQFRFDVDNAVAFPARASAVVLNVTAVAPTASGYLTVYAASTPRPATSDLNFATGQTVAHLVEVAATGPSVTIYNGSRGSLQILVDIVGYIHGGSPGVSGAAGALAATRIVDTRRDNGGSAVGALATLAIPVVGRSGVPGKGVTAVLINVTAVGPAKAGYVTVWPTGAQRPPTSILNFDRTAVSNEVLVPVSPDGSISLFNGSAGSVHLLVDVEGYSVQPFAPQHGAAGTVRAFGNDDLGAVGDGSATVPLGTSTTVAGLTSVVALAGGGLNEYALDSDGTVWSWGPNTVGQIGDGTTTARDRPVKVEGLADVVSVAGGNYVAFAVTADGSVWAWGTNDIGQLGDGHAEITSAVPRRVPGLSGAVQVAAGSGSNPYVLKADGTVWSWGYNYNGSVGDGTNVDRDTPQQVRGITTAVAVAGSGNAGYALLADGTVQAWGADGSGQLGDGTAPGSRNIPGPVAKLTGVTKIAANAGTAYALTNDGLVHAWGNNVAGQIGNGSTDTIETLPVLVSGISGVQSIGAGFQAAYALLADGTVWAWGYAGSGQLGQGGSGNLNIPGPVQGLDFASAVTGNTSAGYVVAGR